MHVSASVSIFPCLLEIPEASEVHLSHAISLGAWNDGISYIHTSISVPVTNLLDDNLACWSMIEKEFGRPLVQL